MEFTVLGAGTWGITLAQILSKNNHTVSVWHYKKQIKLIDKNAYCRKLDSFVSKDIRFLFDKEDNVFCVASRFVVLEGCVIFSVAIVAS